MLKYKLDIEKSKEIYDYFKDCVKVKECYNNVFNVFDLSNKTFREGKWKIAYGYTEVMAGLFCRHCFIIDENNRVIDPTLFAQNEQHERAYYVMYAFDDVDEYLTAIEENDLFPALDKYLREYDKQAHEWAKENGVILVG